MTVILDVTEGSVTLSPVEVSVTLDIETKELTLSADSMTATIATEGPQGIPGDVTVHEATPDPHPQYATDADLFSGLAAKEDTGVAAGLVTAHTAAADPHPQYLTQTESDGRFLQLTGGTLTGTLQTTGHLIANLGQVVSSTFGNINWVPSDVTVWASNGVILQANGVSGPTLKLNIDGTVSLTTDPSAAMHVATKQYVDTQRDTRVLKTGETITPGTLSMGSVVGDRLLLYSTTYGLGIQSGELASFVGAAGEFFTWKTGGSSTGTEWARMSQAGYQLKTGDLTLFRDPTVAMHAATKQYVDITSQGFSFKQACRVVATTNIALTGTPSIDGVAVAVGNRVLAAGQTTASQNGVWIVAAGAWTRSLEMDASGELVDGTLVPVGEGTANQDSQWMCTATGASPWVPNSSTSTWTKFSSLQDLQAGSGLVRTGNIVDVGAGTGITVAADTVSVDTAVISTRSYADTAVSTHDALTTAHAALQGTATPTNASGAAAQVGVSTKFSREDHRHQVPVAAPVDLGPANLTGSLSSMARSDHVHKFPTAANIGLGNVDNTSDANKPVSTLQAAADATKWTMWSGTQAAYTALGTYDAGTLYCVKS